MFVCFLIVALSPLEETNYLLTSLGPKSGSQPGLGARRPSSSWWDGADEFPGPWDAKENGTGSLRHIQKAVDLRKEGLNREKELN